MTTLSSPAGTVEQAGVAAAAAVRRSGVELVELSTAAEANRGADLLMEVWRGSRLPLPGNVIRTIQHIGGYAFGAIDESGMLLACSVGMLSREGLHSQITGVVPYGQRRGLGYALKQHQRWWALERGLRTITWTCDPLVRRNVMFNLHALGASAVAYLPDHYGVMDDGLNSGDETDRFELHWDLAGEQAVAASHQRIAFLSAEDVPVAVAAGPTGLPVTTAVAGLARRVQLPTDIEALRRADVAASRAWRRAVRDAVLPALMEGATVVGLTPSGELVLEGTS